MSFVLMQNPNSCMQCIYPCYLTIFENNYEKFLGKNESNQLRLRVYYLVGYNFSRNYLNYIMFKIKDEHFGPTYQSCTGMTEK